MVNVNAGAARAKKKQKRGKVAKQDGGDQGRVRIGARVAPETLAFLEQLGRPNIGRAIDAAVQIIRESNTEVQVGTLQHPDLPRRVF